MRVVTNSTTRVGSWGCWADSVCIHGGYQPNLRSCLYHKRRSYRLQRRAGMTRPSAASNRRESIAFSGSASDGSQAPEYVQGVQPEPPATVEEQHRGPDSVSVFAAGAVLGVGLACTIVWQRLSRKWTGKDTRQRPEIDDSAHPIAQQQQQRARPLPEPLQALTPQQTRGVRHDASHPESRPAPVIANSSSLLGQAQAVQNRITEQREAPGGFADSTPDPKAGVSDPLADPSALKNSSAAEAQPSDRSKGAVVQQVDIENQQPWKQSDSKKSADTNIDLSMSDDSTSDDAENRADAAEKAASQLSAAAETAPADTMQHTEQQASVADEPVNLQPKHKAAPAVAPPKDAASPSLSESASPVKDTADADRSDTEQSSDGARRTPQASKPEPVEIESGKFVMTTPLEDAAAPADAPATASAPQDKELSESRDASASEPVSVETHDGQTVMTTPLEDAAALNEPVDTGPKTEGDVTDTDPKPVTSPRVVIDTKKSTVVTRPQEGAAASSDATEDAAQSLQEALQEAVDSSSGDSREAPAFAALDASMLDEPGSSISIAPVLFQKPPAQADTTKARPLGVVETTSQSPDVTFQPESSDPQASGAQSLQTRPSEAQPSELETSEPQPSPSEPQFSVTEASPSSSPTSSGQTNLKEDAETNDALSAISSEPLNEQSQPSMSDTAALEASTSDRGQAETAQAAASGQQESKTSSAVAPELDQSQVPQSSGAKLQNDDEVAVTGASTSDSSQAESGEASNSGQQQREAPATAVPTSEQSQAEAPQSSDSGRRESEAAELRRQMAELRQAMADKAASLEAAQARAQSKQPDASTQQPATLSNAPLQSTQQQQSESPAQSEQGPQLQARPQPQSESASQSAQDAQSEAQSQQQQQLQSETQPQSQLQLPSEDQSASATDGTQLPASQPSSSQTQEEDSRPTQSGTQPNASTSAQSSTQQTAPRQPFQVLPRPPTSGKSATIFIEPAPTPETTQRPGVTPVERADEEEDESAADLVAVAAAAMLPHPDKAETGGEDAHFVSSYGRGAFGVADGVGGWNVDGVDPSRYSRLLMQFAEEAILQGQGDYEGGAQDVVGLAHAGITRQGEQEGAVILGSCTVCLAVLKPGGLLEVANVGDSGFRIIRGNEMVFASEAQQHEFNMPFQLACPGPDQYSDTCEDACVYELELEAGDVIVLATDGVLDNLWDDQLAQLVSGCLKDGHRTEDMVKECAHQIVETAQQNSFNTKFRSPWVVEAARVGALPFWQRFRPEGGKVDDCTAIVVCLESGAGKLRQTADKPIATAAVS